MAYCPEEQIQGNVSFSQGLCCVLQVPHWEQEVDEPPQGNGFLHAYQGLCCFLEDGESKWES